jgi:hypothetical protein
MEKHTVRYFFKMEKSMDDNGLSISLASRAIAAKASGAKVMKISLNRAVKLNRLALS